MPAPASPATQKKHYLRAQILPLRNAANEIMFC